MSLPLGWRGWDIPWALLSLVPKGLTPIPEGFAPFLQLGRARDTSASWKGVEILQRFSSSLIFHPPLEHPCGCPLCQLLLWCWSLSQKQPLKSLCIVGFTQPKKIQPLPPRLTPPCSQTRYFCSQLPVEIWGGEALPTAPAAPRALCRWESDAVGFWSGFWGGSEALGGHLMQKLGLGGGRV